MQDVVRTCLGWLSVSCLLVFSTALPVASAEEIVPAAGTSSVSDAAKRGYVWLTTTPLLPPDFDDEVFESVWTVWPQPLRDQARY